MLSLRVVSNLEKLALRLNCVGINNFNISAPKLKSLYALVSNAFEPRCLSLHLKAIKILCLYGDLLSRHDVAVFTTARNLQVITLYDLEFGRGKQITVALELLEKSPNVCEWEIIATNKLSSWRDDKEAASRLMEDPDGCLINKDLKMLSTIKIESFSGSILEMLFVKALLLKSHRLEKVFIQESADIDATMAFKIPRELLSFPRASSRAQLVFMECKSKYSLVEAPWVKLLRFDET